MVRKKSRKSKNEKRLEKELLYILGFMVFLIILFVFASSIFKGFNTFEYEGMTFTKERLGEIPFYHYYYLFTNKDNVLVQYNLYLRNDPRENEIPIFGDEIFLEENKAVYMTVEKNEELNVCPYGVLGVTNLISFLGDNDYVVEGGNPDFHSAKENNETWVNCETHKYNPVVKVVKGDVSQITVEGNCYEISVASCEDFLLSTEKFTLQILIDARERLGLND
tara:strand:+ start:547 stop:1212 length:666 start_codon:yes stop_codon:yes gene_type:complete